MHKTLPKGDIFLGSYRFKQCGIIGILPRKAFS
jgi:hypothetical protein